MCKTPDSTKSALSTVTTLTVHHKQLWGSKAPDLKPSVFVIIRSLNHLKMHIITELKMQIDNLLLIYREIWPYCLFCVTIQFLTKVIL